MLARSILMTIASIALLNPGAYAAADRSTIQGRMEIERHERCLQVRIYLKNTRNQNIQIVTGAGGVDDDREVVFLHDGLRCTGTRWSSVSYRRSMKPVFRGLPPGKEVLYGEFVVPDPLERKPSAFHADDQKRDFIETLLDLYGDDRRDTLYQVEMRSAIAR